MDIEVLTWFASGFFFEDAGESKEKIAVRKPVSYIPTYQALAPFTFASAGQSLDGRALEGATDFECEKGRNHMPRITKRTLNSLLFFGILICVGYLAAQQRPSQQV